MNSTEQFISNISSTTTRYIEITEPQQGQRLDNFLLGKLKGVPRSHIYRIIRSGEVRINSRRCRPLQRLKTGDRIRVPPIFSTFRNRTPPERKYLSERIIYEDDQLLILDKPAGLAVHGGSGLNAGAIESLRRLRRDLDYLELAHRLDRDTSGCLLMAKNAGTLRLIHRFFREQKIDKYYLALVAGHWPGKLQNISAPLVRDQLQSGERLAAVAAEGRCSETDFKVLQHFSADGHYSLLEAKPLTGRMHQVRVHCRYAGFPVCGDPRYGDSNTNKILKKIGLRRLFLHAWKLQINEADLELKIEAPLPVELQTTLKQINRQ